MAKLMINDYLRSKNEDLQWNRRRVRENQNRSWSIVKSKTWFGIMTDDLNQEL